MLTGNNLGLLALVKTLPSHEEVEAFSKTDEMKEILDANMDTYIRTTRIHLKAKQLLENGRVMDAWKVLLM
ncbi:hypothetical protein [Sphingobacterium paludis]|uniref:Uncharacterized protein n=1 Tax=Sphingobacterium paludis TaxID=1476465 RepID=A0A4R7D404_9SPHI|nr:hypothetical protein [Sphingobacterium paludis]TDS14861.1 hypothetical protein B0I21_103361 [Sphingobacterium paludis]